VLAKDAKNAFTLGQIPPSMREKYRRAGEIDSAAVQLDCKSCHSLDGTPGSSGKYFAPVKFDPHCQACHDTQSGPAIAQGKQVVPSFAVPHGQSLDELEKRIESAYSKEMQKQHQPLFATPNPFDPKRANEPAVIAYQKDVKDATTTAVNFLLRDQCSKCHLVEGRTVPKSNIPAVWLQHSTFDHTAHRMADCKLCHPNADQPLDASKPDYEREPVNIKGIETCRECHAPASGNQGGVKHGCTDCHRFHGGDQPLHGRGNEIRFPKDPMTVEELLRGRK
jgi:hypothetical protein